MMHNELDIGRDLIGIGKPQFANYPVAERKYKPDQIDMGVGRVLFIEIPNGTLLSRDRPVNTFAGNEDMRWCQTQCYDARRL